jgi:squalene-hopene/tetraprenyl-beta-curcumene cyclase
MNGYKYPISHALTSFNGTPVEDPESTSPKTGAKIHHLPSSIWKKKNIDQTSPLDIAIERSCEFFFREQMPDGYWWAELESNVTITAEYIMLFHFLGMVDKER